MGHSNQTTNFELSQFDGTDKPAWLEDYNTDMGKIDTALKTASDNASDAASAIAELRVDVNNASTTATSADTKSTASLSNQAPTYDATDTYSVGDRVLYQNIMYKCLTAISMPEVFDGSKWTRVTNAEEFSALEEAIEDVDDKFPTVVDISSQLVSAGYAQVLSAYKYGKLVTINIRYDPIFTGLILTTMPKPLTAITVDGTYIDSAGNVSGGDFTINEQGELLYVHHYGGNAIKRIEFTYLTRD